MGRTFRVLFPSFAVLGTMSLFGFILWAFLSLRRDMRKLIAFSRSLSRGDETQPLDITEDGEIGALGAELRRIGSREALAARLRAASERLVADFPSTAENAVRLQDSFTGQTQIVKDTSRGLADVTQTVRDVARNAASSLEAAREGGNAVETSLQTIQRAIDAAKLLEERASRIEEVVALIGDVADQTELLSLNAAIEAARAGEAGRGFTVVAQQVRKLADRSARSVSEVADLALVVLEAVRRIASDATNSFQTIEALRRDLQGMSNGLASITHLANAAVDGAGRMESALAQALELGSDTTRRAQAIATANRTLKEEVAQVADIMSRMPPGRTPQGQLTRLEMETDQGAGPAQGAGAGAGARESAGATDAAERNAAEGSEDRGWGTAAEAGQGRQDVMDLRGPLPGRVEEVDAIEELPPAEDEPEGGEDSLEASPLEELESAEED
jgi:methyl-accepting chemotaxis protein